MGGRRYRRASLSSHLSDDITIAHMSYLAVSWDELERSKGRPILIVVNGHLDKEYQQRVWA
jgi:hypothetical protein